MKLVLCDIDGCLTEGKNAPLVLNNLLTIKSLLKTREISLTLCTGRSQPYVELFCQILDIKLPCICENGNYLYFPKSSKMILNPLISSRAQKEFINLKENIIPSIFIKTDYSIEPCKDYMLSINTKKSIQSALILVSSAVDNNIFDITYSSSAIDISIKGVNKGSGFNLLRKNLKINNIIGIGDSIADISFLGKCDYICAPYNAHKEVKEISNFISEFSFSKGIINILEHL